MKPINSNNPLSDSDTDLEGHDLWDLLGDVTSTDPSPRFLQETLHRVRLEKDEQKSPWWRVLFAPKPLIGFTGAALATIVIAISLPSNPAPSDRAIAEIPQVTEDFDQLEDTFATELLSGAAEDPSLLSDEEIVALLY